VKVDVYAYRDWHQQFADCADAVASLDSISGDWKQGLANAAIDGGFVTYHDTDPPELLDDLVAMARERKQWLGIGLLPPRSGRDAFLRRTLGRIPEQIHVHLWAGRAYTYMRRLDSVDSTNWFRDAMLLRERGAPLGWLSYAECVDLIVKRYQREQPKAEAEQGEQDELWKA
jgi:hypothetical protein